MLTSKTVFMASCDVNECPSMGYEEDALEILMRNIGYAGWQVIGAGATFCFYHKLHREATSLIESHRYNIVVPIIHWSDYSVSSLYQVAEGENVLDADKILLDVPYTFQDFRNKHRRGASYPVKVEIAGFRSILELDNYCKSAKIANRARGNVYD